MGEFRFKQFTVRQDASALKVGTDAVLLGAAMTLLPSDRTLLDVGTGTGVIALMAAQRLAVPDSDGGVSPHNVPPRAFQCNAPKAGQHHCHRHRRSFRCRGGGEFCSVAVARDAFCAALLSAGFRTGRTAGCDFLQSAIL